MEVSGRLHDLLEHLDKRKNLPLPGIETRPRGFPARTLVTIVTILPPGDNPIAVNKYMIP